MLGLLALMFMLSVSLGSGNMGIREVITPSAATAANCGNHAVQIRLPRVAGVIVAGLAMGMAGC